MPLPRYTHILTCLGYPELRTVDGSAVRVRVKKHLALLVYLAVERRRGHDRDRLVELLWPRVPTSQGRHSCATALSALRSIFGSAALTNARNIVRFIAPSLDVDLDVLDRGDVLAGDDVPSLKVDAFLRGFDIDDAPEFTLWKEREHSRRVPSIQAWLLSLIDRGRRRGSHDDILAWADRLLSIDQLSEEGIRAKVEGHVLAGQRMEAIRAFEEWKDRLAYDLEVKPFGPVVDIVAQLRREPLSVSGYPRPRVKEPVPFFDTPFVGREDEYRTLYETWEAANQFFPQYLFVEGESGIGKTTIARRLLAAAELEGATVAQTQSFEMEQTIPYPMIGGLVTALLGRPGFSATSPECLSQLSQIVPGIRDTYQHLPPARAFEGESARLHLAEAVLDLITAVGLEKPLLLVVDDLHFADRASQAVLRLVARRLTKARVMLLATFRHDAEGSPPLFTSLSPSAHGNRSTFLRLDAMNERDSAALFDAILRTVDARPNPTEQRALIRASAGSPLAIQLMADDWQAHGRKSLAFELSAFRPFRNKLGRQQNRLETLVDQLLGTLDRPTRQVLSLASALGPLLNRPDMYGVGGLDRPSVLNGLSELARRRIIRPIGERLDFANELVRAYAYRAMPAALREEVHSDIAARLMIERHAGAPVAPLAVAWHLVQAGRRSEATALVIEGAREAILRGSPDDATLALETFCEDHHTDRIAELMCLLAQAHSESGRWVDALQIAAQSERAAEDPSFRLLAIEARWQLGVIDPGEEQAAVEELLTIGAERRSPLWPRALSVAAFIAGNSNNATLVATAETALPAIEDLPPTVRARVLTARAVLAFHQRLTARGQADAQQACAILDNLGATDSSRVSLELGLGAFDIARGDYLGALPRLRRAQELAHRLDNSALASVVRGNLSIALFRLGLFDDSVRESAAGILDREVVARLNATYARCGSLVMLGRQADALEHICAPALARAAESKAWTLQKLHFERADIALLCGRQSQALAEAKAGLGLGADRPLARGTVGWWARWAGIIGNRTTSEYDAFRAEVDRLDRLDALDRYELVTTIRETRWLHAYRSRAVDEEFHRLEVSLPPSTIAFARRLCESAAGLVNEA